MVVPPQFVLHGPWDEEPNQLRWRDPATGYQCFMSRHPWYLIWCGYVRVPRSHPAYGQETYKFSDKQTGQERRAKRQKRKAARAKWVKEAIARAPKRLHAKIKRAAKRARPSIFDRSDNPRNFGSTILNGVQAPGGLSFSGQPRVIGRGGHRLRGYRLPGYWIGFDCNHSHDFAPGMEMLIDTIYHEQGDTMTRAAFAQSCTMICSVTWP